MGEMRVTLGWDVGARRVRDVRVPRDKGDGLAGCARPMPIETTRQPSCCSNERSAVLAPLLTPSTRVVIMYGVTKVCLKSFE